MGAAGGAIGGWPPRSPAALPPLPDPLAHTKSSAYRVARRAYAITPLITPNRANACHRVVVVLLQHRCTLFDQGGGRGQCAAWGSPRRAWPPLAVLTCLSSAASVALHRSAPGVVQSPPFTQAGRAAGNALNCSKPRMEGGGSSRRSEKSPRQERFSPYATREERRKG